MKGLLENIVPRQLVGSQTGASAGMSCGNTSKAKALYADAVSRLLDINRWGDISGVLSASFQLTDKEGRALEACSPGIGNLIRIGLPGPGNAAGEGYDWVRIVSITNSGDKQADEDICALMVKPVANPHSHSKESAHFYTAAASSTFVVWRRGIRLRAMEFGRNEIPNKKVSLFNRLRNIIVAWAARTGLATPQWKALMTGILRGAS